MKKKTSFDWPLFLLGLFSMTEVRLVGSMAIAEAFIFAAAPIFFIQDQAQLKKDGFMPLILLSFAVMISNGISCAINHSDLQMALRGVATTYSVFAIPVVVHRYLRRNLNGLKWFLIGGTLSSIISIFVFQKSTEVSLADREGLEATEAIIGSAFLITARIGVWLALPIRAFYLQTPLIYSILEPILYAGYFLLTSASGRSAAMVSASAAALMFIGGKSRRKMNRVQKYFWILLCAAVVAMSIGKAGYVYAAKNNILGEEARRKYEYQTKGNDSFAAIVVGGRSDFFMGLAAAIDRPLFGYGPWPVDTYGVAENFLYKYGDAEDIARHEKLKAFAAMHGFSRVGWIPTHSHLIGFWVWYGLAGLILWLYVLYVLIYVVRKGMAAIPQWYGYICMLVTSFFWAILFSPYGNRILTMTGVTCLLLVKAVCERRIGLPWTMENEARRYDRK